jgi:hypothetical protein
MVESMDFEQGEKEMKCEGKQKAEHRFQTIPR